MKTSCKGIDLIKKYESFRSKPYLCPAGIPTIGYGATYYPGGRKVKLTDGEISEQTATKLLMAMLPYYENAVNRYVQSSISQNQFDAVVSFTYNVGVGNLQSSTLLKRINSNPNDPDIAYQFSRWVRSEGRKLRGLIRRRNEESELYFS